MTAYISDAPYAGRHHFWTDTPEELAGWSFMFNGSLEAGGANGGYLLTGDQRATALAIGAHLTDWLGPARWLQEGKRGLAVTGGPYKHLLRS